MKPYVYKVWEVRKTNLRQIRESKGKLQQEVAEVCNVTQGAVSLWESGHTRLPKKYRRIYCSLFHLTEEELTAAVVETMSNRRKQ